MAPSIEIERDACRIFEEPDPFDQASDRLQGRRPDIGVLWCLRHSTYGVYLNFAATFRAISKRMSQPEWRQS
jgi:hypothetical protein